MLNIRNGSFYSFIPMHLAIKERPELNIFPYNVLIAMYGANKEGKTEMASVVYEPALLTHIDNGKTQSLSYFNIYNSDYRLEISFDNKEESYSCQKFYKENLLVIADGREWKMFFVQVGILGLANGENCLFREINH